MENQHCGGLDRARRQLHNAIEFFADPFSGHVPSDDGDEIQIRQILAAVFTITDNICKFSELCREPVVVGRDRDCLLLHKAVHYRCLPEILELIIEANPEALVARGTKGFTPLHEACDPDDMRRCRADILCKVFRLFVTPESARSWTSDGRLPIHLYCSNYTVDPEGLGILVDAYPESVNERTSTGSLALHLLCTTAPNDRKLQAIRFIFNLSPECIQTKDRAGNTCLHLACSIDEENSGPHRYQLTEFLVTSYPQALEEVNSQGRTPFHLFCLNMNTQDSATLCLLLNACPQSANELDGAGCTPLHLYCSEWFQSGRDRVPTFRRLLEANPEALSTQDNQGRTPLHIVLSETENHLFSFPPPVLVPNFRLLVNGNPQALTTRDSEERTPLHFACSNIMGPNSNLEVIRFLLEANSRCASALDRDGCTPLRLCCRRVSESPRELELLIIPTIKLLLEAYPEALKVKATNGHTPLYSVCCHDALISMDCLRLLTPRCRDELEESGGEAGTPLHALCIGRTRTHRLDALRILSISEKAVRATNSIGQNPLHLLCRDGGSRDECRVLLDQYSELSAQQDNEGQTPLHMAVKRGMTVIAWKRSRCTRAVETLLASCPRSAQVEDRKGRTPFMLACEKKLYLDMIYRLVCFDPLAALSDLKRHERSAPNDMTVAEYGRSSKRARKNGPE